MNYNILTTSEQYNIFSYLQNFEDKKNLQSATGEIETKEDIDLGSFLSIVLKREEIIEKLNSCFRFESLTYELDFLIANIDIVKLLPSIGNYIKNKFDPNAILSLELMSEDSDWQTLFINVKSEENWEKADKFINTFLDNIYETYPQIAEKLNVNIMPNEF